jgi:hypothetical protein
VVEARMNRKKKRWADVSKDESSRRLFLGKKDLMKVFSLH